MPISLRFTHQTKQYRLSLGGGAIPLSVGDLRLLAAELRAVASADYLLLPGFGPRSVIRIGDYWRSITPIEHQQLYMLVQQELTLLEAKRLLERQSPKLSR